MIDRLGATRLGVWVIKHIVSPTQRLFYRVSGGRAFTTAGPDRDVLLLTTKGRITGKDRTIPVYYFRDADRIIICNVNPGFERTNPWVTNLRAYPTARVQMGSELAEYHAREATEVEISSYWPRLLRIWPGYAYHYEKSQQRAVFVLERS